MEAAISLGAVVLFTDAAGDVGVKRIMGIEQSLRGMHRRIQLVDDRRTFMSVRETEAQQLAAFRRYVDLAARSEGHACPRTFTRACRMHQGRLETIGHDEVVDRRGYARCHGFAPYQSGATDLALTLD